LDRTWLYTGLLFAGGVGLLKVMAKGPTIKRGERLLLVGDSLAVGLAPPLGQLAKENGVLFDAVGQVGSTVKNWSTGALNVQLRQKLTARPKVVLVSLGTNDEALMMSQARLEIELLEPLMALIRASGAEIGWIGPPKFLPGQSFSPNGFTLAIQRRVPSADYFPSEQYDIPRGGDRLHPTVKGYAGWAGAIWQWLRCCHA
jgi:lysophospholipase L1-like esterase